MGVRAPYGALPCFVFFPCPPHPSAPPPSLPPILGEPIPPTQPGAAAVGGGPTYCALRPWCGGLGSPWLGLPALFLQVFVAQEVVPASRPLPRPADLSQADLGASLLRTGKGRVISRADQDIWGTWLLQKVWETPFQVRWTFPGRKRGLVVSRFQRPLIH